MRRRCRANASPDNAEASASAAAMRSRCSDTHLSATLQVAESHGGTEPHRAVRSRFVHDLADDHAEQCFSVSRGRRAISGLPFSLTRRWNAAERWERGCSL